MAVDAPRRLRLFRIQILTAIHPGTIAKANHDLPIALHAVLPMMVVLAAVDHRITVAVAADRRVALLPPEVQHIPEPEETKQKINV